MTIAAGAAQGTASGMIRLRPERVRPQRCRAHPLCVLRGLDDTVLAFRAWLLVAPEQKVASPRRKLSSARIGSRNRQAGVASTACSLSGGINSKCTSLEDNP